MRRSGDKAAGIRAGVLCLKVLCLCLLSGLAAAVEAPSAPAWDVSAPLGERRQIPLDVRTGTWMSLDVSPDGRRIVFDLLGDLYEIPIEGGDARALTSGMAWDYQPEYSPDGRSIVFTSDRGGGDNLWLMTLATREFTQVSDEDYRLLNAPAWHPNGRYVAGRKHYTTRRSLGAGEIWIYNTEGGNGTPLVERPNENYQRELGEPAFSRDGRFLYYTQNAVPGDVFEYAQDVNAAIFAIRRLELATNEVETIVSGAGGAVRPTPSPDGRFLAFVRRLRTESALRTALFVKDLRSGEERMLNDGLDRDLQETWGIDGLYPNMAWTPDSRAIVFWAGGKINRVDVASRAVRDIPFHVVTTRDVISPHRFDVDVAPADVRSRMVRFASASPDGRRVVFEAFGRLWLKDVAGGASRPLTRDGGSGMEFFPSWSRDGRSIAFVRWSDTEFGSVRVVSGRGGASRAVTDQPGHYRNPRFSPDGAAIVFERVESEGLTSPLWSADPGVYIAPARGGAMRRLAENGRNPHFATRSDRVFFTEEAARREGQPAHLLKSYELTDGRQRVHARSQYSTRMELSPDGQWLAFYENRNIYVTPMPPGGAIAISPDLTSMPVARASEIGGDYFAWLDGDTITWTLGPELYRADASALTARLEEAEEPRFGTRVADLTVTRPSDRPSGVVALTGARIITMNGTDQVIENGVILIRDNRIAAVGAAGSVEIPAGARRLDLQGRTVMPGLIDVHAHVPTDENEIIPQQNWAAASYLAFGVTTAHDPGGTNENFSLAEYQRAGVTLGPRMFTTGNTVYGAHAERFAAIDTIEDARRFVARLRAQGAISVKNYNQPRRDQRQMVTTAAREAGLTVVAEGGSRYHLDMSFIVDGIAGVEHNVPVERFYDDVKQLWPATGVGNTPTIIVNFGGPFGEDYFYQEAPVWQHPILSRFVPPDVLRPRSVRPRTAPATDYQPLRDSAANAQWLMQAGILVNIGGHGQREGLGSHWDLWLLAMNGMSAMDALRSATINPARYLGLARDLGSIETGKLADLVVLDGNPLEDIRKTDDVAFVVLNGRIYEGGTLNETITGTRRLSPFYWQ